MSSLVYLPMGQSLDYWYLRLSNHQRRNAFILTKVLELVTYKARRLRSPWPIAAGTRRRPSSAEPDPLRVRPTLVRHGVSDADEATVVIPVHACRAEDIEMLERLLDRLASQSERPTVVVVNDGSTFALPSRSEVKVLSTDQCRGPAAARNLGIEWALQSGAKVVFFTDADCLPEVDWIETGLRRFRANPFMHLVSGCTRALDRSWLGRYHDINGTLNGRRFAGTKLLLYGPTCNLAATAEVLQAVRFHESFTRAACEDIHFCFGAYRRGFLIHHAEDMMVRHDFGYDRATRLGAIRRFSSMFSRYAESEALLVEHIPDYHDYFVQTVEISVELPHAG